MYHNLNNEKIVPLKAAVNQFAVNKLTSEYLKQKGVQLKK